MFATLESLEKPTTTSTMAAGILNKTKTIFKPSAIDNGLLPDFDVCAEVVAGKGALEDGSLISFLQIEEADELASLVG